MLTKQSISDLLKDIFEDGTYDTKLVDVASYHLRIDDKELTVGGIRYGDNNPYPYQANRGKIVLPRHQISLVSTIERFHLPEDLVARGGISLRLAKRGLIGLFGPQIEPGYKGRFYAVIWNAGPNDVELDKGEGLLKVEFLKTDGKQVGSTTPGMADFDSAITAKSLNGDLEEELRKVSESYGKAEARITRLEGSMDESIRGYRTVTVFAVFLIAATILGVMLNTLFQSTTTLVSVLGPELFALIFLLLFITIPVLAVIVVYDIVKRGRKET